jgi:broad specificity phosphatase PhoE
MESSHSFWEIVLALFLLASCATGEGAKTGASATSGAADQMEASQLCVVRHAQAYGNLKGAPPGLTTEQLNTLTEKGRIQAKKLGAEVPRPVRAVFASPTGRTRMTAELMELGEPIGLTGELSALEDESLDAGRERILEAIDRARAEGVDGKHIVMVTHGKVASLLIGELKGTPLSERVSAHQISYGEAVCLPMQESETD